MKKQFLLTILSVFVVSQIAYATDITVFRQNTDTEAFNTITITATGSGDIQKAYGLNLMLLAGTPIIWNRDFSGVVFGGDAASKVVMPFVPVISTNGFTMNIPLNVDFTAGQVLTIDGLKVRTYDRTLDSRALGLDVNGDGTSERDVHILSINAVGVTDFIKPYDPANFQAVYNPTTKKVDLSWVNPPDFDFNQENLNRKLTRGGQTTEEYLWQGQYTFYTDENVQQGDSITYMLMASDSHGNLTNTLEKTVTIALTPVEPPVAPPANESTEMTFLNRQFAAYKIRYSIKCNPAGGIVQTGDSACLWAKIDLIYTQEKLGKNDVAVSLSSAEKALIAKRIVFSEARYQDACVNAAVAPKYCSATERGIQRAHYLLD